MHSLFLVLVIIFTVLYHFHLFIKIIKLHVTRGPYYAPSGCNVQALMYTSRLRRSILGPAYGTQSITPLKFFIVTTGTPIHVCCFKNNRIPCNLSCRKAALHSYSCPINGTPGAIFPKFLCNALLSFLTYIASSVQIGSGLEELQPRNHSEAC